MNNTLKITGLAILGTVLASSLDAQPSIRLRNPSSVARRSVNGVTRGAGHFILVFNSTPSADTRAELINRGIRILQFVPDTGLMVAMSASTNLDGLDLAYTTKLAASEKVAPSLANSSSNFFLVIFHSDVETSKINRIAQDAGFDSFSHPALLPNQILAAGSSARLHSLAGNDEVSYILPASPELVSGAPVAGCPGAVTEGGAIGEYSVVGSGWSKDAKGAVALKYVIQNLTQKMDSNVARAEIERAFREWTKFANLTFTPAERADAARTIAIKFGAGAHGDGFPFDGPRKVLAHTFYPSGVSVEPIAGDMHMDGDEDWMAGAGVDLYSVTLHELGHALGLGHSSQPGAVMYPYYRQAAGLTDDDIAGVQSLYGTVVEVAPVQPMLEAPALQPGQPAVAPVAPVAPAAPAAPVAPAAKPAVKDTVTPVVKIVSQTATMVTTSAASITLSGTATDNVGVVEVKWTGAAGAAGVAAGTGNWTVNVPLMVGTNAVVVRAFDAAGNSAWRSITVVRR